jgi:hypothetical protein
LAEAQWTRRAVDEERSVIHVFDDTGELGDLRVGGNAVGHRNVDIAQSCRFDRLLFGPCPLIGTAQIDDGRKAKRLERGDRAVLEKPCGRNVRLEPRIIDGERARFIPERRLSDRRLGENGRRPSERADYRCNERATTPKKTQTTGGRRRMKLSSRR